MRGRRDFMRTGSRKPVVLIVDDEPDIGEMLARLFSEEGYGTTAVVNGKEAVKRVLEGGVDVVLLDVIMPEPDGLDVLRQIKSIRSGLPVIMMTAFGTLTTARNAKHLGAYDYITKPFDFECVKEIMQQGLEEFSPEGMAATQEMKQAVRSTR